MIILLHSSKTMRIAPAGSLKMHEPELLHKAVKLDEYLKTLSPAQLQKSMKISAALAQKTHALIQEWNAERENQSLALDSFIGDIYSGLQANKLSPADRDYADKTLRILSGLYGIIRPYDGIYPYRLELEYKFPDPEFASLYRFWGKSIADCIPEKGLIINLASDEFSDTVTPFVDTDRVIAPKFLTEKKGEPTFVVIHAKITRGAFAHWLIKSRTQDAEGLKKFQDLGYRFDPKLSTSSIPVFVCKEFGGKGLSMKKLGKDTKD